MANGSDKTLTDNNRRLLNLRKSEIENVLPEHFGEDYPKLIALFDAYYDWMDKDDNPTRRIQDLNKNRDLTQVEESLLQYIEDELLLGQAYFGGFLNKREASRYSNLLYRSKGTKFSIQQFFRAFYGVDVDVIYPRDQVFIVGPTVDLSLATNNDAGGQVTSPGSIIGPDSLKFLTNDKLYQTLSILIRSELPFDLWRDVYKLFVHPAGMYLAGEIQIVTTNTNTIDAFMPDVEFVVGGGVAIVTSVGSFDPTANTSVTHIIDSDGVEFRSDVTATIRRYQTIPLSQINNTHRDFYQFLTPTSRTFDDSADSNGKAMRFDDTTFETFDQSWYDSIGTY